MPHKRPKRSLREQQKNEAGHNLEPNKSSIASEAIPKSVSRVLNALQIRKEWADKKRKLNGEDAGGGGQRKRQKVNRASDSKLAEGSNKGTSLKILPGESIQHFNKRVEDDMRPLVKDAIQTSRALLRGSLKTQIEAKAERKLQSKKAASTDEPKDTQKSKHASIVSPESVPKPQPSPIKEFTKSNTSAPRRLNDIAQAPPDLNHPRLAAKVKAAHGSLAYGKREGVVSMAQKLMMEQERDRVIKRYRELRAKQKSETEEGEG